VIPFLDRVKNFSCFWVFEFFLEIAPDIAPLPDESASIRGYRSYGSLISLGFK